MQSEFEFDFDATPIGVVAVPPGNTGALQAGSGAAYPSDEEILGIEDERAVEGRGANASNVIPSGVAPGFAERDEARNPSSVWPQQGEAQRDSSAAPAAPGLPRNDGTQPAAAQVPPAWLRPLLADPKSGPEATKLWAQHAAFRAVFPGGAREAQEMAARANEFSAIDRAYFSGEAPAQAELANWLLRDNPDAFRAMLQQGARVLADRDPAAFAEFARAFGTATAAQFATPFAELGAAAVPAGFSVAPASLPAGLDRSAGFQAAGFSADSSARDEAAQNRRLDPSTALPSTPLGTGRAGAGATEPAMRGGAPAEWAQLERARGELRAEQFAAFQQSANDAVVEHVRGSIAQTLGSVLPANVSDAARQRLAEAVFHEINTTLQRDPALTEQVAAVARSGRFDAATRQQVVDLIARRARQMVAPVAKRVVGEWTASFVGAHRARSQRLEQAAARVDLAGGGAPETVSRRALSPGELDYTVLTDEQILSL